MMKRENIINKWSIPHRHAFMKGTGYSDEQIKKPLIGVLNAWGEINPAAGNLGHLTERIKSGVEASGGTPMEFCISSMCIGMAGGSRGASYGLAYRDIVADYIEIISESNLFDGLIITSVCDDVVPAHLMAAARLNLPTILVLGGYMPPRMHKGKLRYAAQIGSAYGELQKGTISQAEYKELEDIVCGNSGACPIMGTANTMGAIAETLGMTLPGNSTMSGVDPSIGRLAYDAGSQIVHLVDEGIRSADLMTEESFKNAIRVFLALGGSTNALIHLPAVAYEIGLPLPLTLFDSLSKQTPYLCDIKPCGQYTMKEFDEAGGLPALINEMLPVLNGETLTVTGKTLAENNKNAKVLNPDIIHSLSGPIMKEGGVAILSGTLAPNGAVVKVSGVAKGRLTKKGPAKVFDSEKQACDSLLNNEINPGDIVVIRYVGPKGDPGMRITARFSWILSGMNLSDDIVMITDGRFSGTNEGGAIGHVSPEASVGGPIALVQNGDMIEVNIPNRKVDLLVAEKELERRRSLWRPQKDRYRKGLLSRISGTILPVEDGAVLKRHF
ncbi:MAG: dihydroxy-acid dehydratase [Desulfobacteraceae bacterium]|nr:dihydroxy-acid dehydratase [Desulfobacteraceae bacterium]